MPIYRNDLKGFRAFGEGALEDFFGRLDISIQCRVNDETENYILNVNETEYVNHLTNEFTIEPVHLDFDSMSIFSQEELIPAERFPKFDFDVDPGQSYPKDVFVFHIPISGDSEMIRLGSNVHYDTHFKGYFEDGHLCFEVIDFYRDTERIKRAGEELKTKLSSQYQRYCQAIEKYNSSLNEKIKGIFSTRKQKILDKYGRLASIGVPLKKKENLPQTYSIPTPQARRCIYPKPQVTETGYIPHPTLELARYTEILQTRKLGLTTDFT